MTDGYLTEDDWNAILPDKERTDIPSLKSGDRFWFNDYLMEMTGWGGSSDERYKADFHMANVLDANGKAIRR